MKLVNYHRPRGAFENMFDSLNLGLFPAASRSCGVAASDEPALRLPRTNIEEREDGFEFTMEMPGLAKKDVEVTLENDTLVVKGEKVEKSEEKEDKGILRREIRSSKFERSFSLGKQLDHDSIKARMADGILTITVPKKEQEIGRKVDVS
jgi:HSP20 family protein